MELINTQQLNTLLNHEGTHSISIVIPTEAAGRETRQNAIRYKNALDEVQNRLQGDAMRAPDIQEYLRPLSSLETDRDYWQNQLDGLAIYFDGNNREEIKLPYQPQTTVQVGPHYFIKPLLPLFLENEQFAILLLSQGSVRLLQATRYGYAEQAFPDDTPTSLEEAMRFEDPERQLQQRTSSAPGADGQHVLFHGHESDRELQKNLKRFLQVIDKAVNSMLGSTGRPVMLVGTDAMRGMYLQVSSYAHLHDKHVSVHPGEFSLDALHEMAWDQYLPEYEARLGEHVDRFHALGDDSQSITSMEKVLQSAVHGRVETLFLPREEEVWGMYDVDADQLTTDDADALQSYELMNYAAMHTVKNGGRVLITDEDTNPAQEGAAAILRY